MIECLTALLLAVFPGQAPAQSMAFWNASIVDLDAGVVRSGMVVEISKGRITRVAPAVGARPANATVADGTGRFLIPGLWDAHVHLTKLGEASLSLFLANGVTSVRDMGSDLEEVVRWRREIESGARPGPRIKTPGQILESRANVERMKREGNGRTGRPDSPASRYRGGGSRGSCQAVRRRCGFLEDSHRRRRGHVDCDRGRCPRARAETDGPPRRSAGRPHSSPAWRASSTC